MGEIMERMGMACEDAPRVWIIRRADCSDAYAASYGIDSGLAVASLDIERVALDFGDPPPDAIAAGDAVFVVGMWFEPVVLAELRERGATVGVFDNHPTALACLCDDEYALIDVKRSVGRMVWEEITGEVDPLMSYIDDRRGQRWALRGSRMVNAVIDATPREFESWSRLANRLRVAARLAECIEYGEKLLEAETTRLERLAERVYMTRVGGYDGVPVVNAGPEDGGVCELLLDRFPCALLAATHFDRGGRKRVWRLRSRTVGLNVRLLAEEFGGGGSSRAASFSEEICPAVGGHRALF